MPGRKAHEQQIRTFERKPDLPDDRRTEEALRQPPAGRQHEPDADARSSEFPVSRSGMNSESDHNKHNDQRQPGHKPQSHGPGEEKS